MNTSVKIVVLTALVAAFGPAMADDAPAATKAQMHDCMAKQRAAHPDRSDKAMRKTCQNQLQTLEDHPSVPVSPNGTPAQDSTPAPTSTPPN